MAEYPNVEKSCGCVFCDLDLATIDDAEFGYIHQVTSCGTDGFRYTKFIPCPVKNAGK